MTLPDTAEHEAVPLERGPAAVLWDMDGTLVDTEPYWFAAERDLVEEFGHGHWPDELAHEMIGSDLLDGARFLQEHGGVEMAAEEIVDRLLDGVIARLHREIPWRPGARELLAELGDAGVPCALVTMSWRRFVDPVVAALPDGTFVATITGDEVPAGEGKPSPTPYRLGAEACGVTPDACLAIEDSPTGIRSALAAGCRVLGVPNYAEIRPADGLRLIGSLADLDVARLTRLWSTGAWDGDGPDPFGGDLVDPGSGRGVDGHDGERQGPLDTGPGTWWRIDRRAAVLLALVIGVVAVVAVALTRDGGEPEPPPLPPGAVAIDVWAPYWRLADSVPEADLRLPDVREISPFWFDVAGEDEIVVNPNASERRTERFLDRVADAPGRLVPSINDTLPPGAMAEILADPARRTAHVETLVAFADELDADGLDLDYERFAFFDGRDTWATTRPNWVAFVEELAAALHADDRTLTVSIPGVWGLVETDDGPVASEGYEVYDHAAIAPHVDAIRIMAYDYSFDEPGPIAPLPWVQDLVDTLSAIVPEEHHDKLVLGVPSYGLNWVVDTAGECPASAEGRTSVQTRAVDELAARRGGVPAYDDVTAEWSFAYELEVAEGASTCVQQREVRWVDADGVAARVEIARRAGWGGVALWALGFEDDEVWTSLVAASRRPLSAEPSTAQDAAG